MTILVQPSCDNVFKVLCLVCKDNVNGEWISGEHQLNCQIMRWSFFPVTFKTDRSGAVFVVDSIYRVVKCTMLNIHISHCMFSSHCIFMS